MTPRQEHELAILIGKLSGQFEGMKEVLDDLKVKADEAVEWRHEVKDRLEKMEQHGTSMNKVAEAFAKLQKSIHEGTIQAKAGSKGFLIGLTVTASSIGAVGTTFIKWLYTTINTAITGG